MDVYTQPNAPEGVTEKGLTAWVAVIAAAVLTIGILTGELDLITIGNKLFNLALYAAFVVLFNLFFLSRRNNVNENIFSTPLSTAVYCGLVALGGAVTVS